MAIVKPREGFQGTADSTSQLQFIAGRSGYKVLVKDVGVFEWMPSGTPNGTTSFSASVSGIWESVIGSGAGATTLNDLTDVTITSETSGQALKWNGSEWVNDTDAEGASLPAEKTTDIFTTKNDFVYVEKQGVIKKIPIELLNTGGIVSKGFTPKDITGLVLHYDINALKTLTIPEITSGPNLKVSQINDLSGNNFHLTQTDPSLRPLLEFGTGPNGAACLRFDGAQRIKYNDTTLGLSQPSTFFMVMRHGDWNGSGATLLDFTNAHNTGLYYVTQSGKNQMVNAAGAYANGGRYSYTNMLNKWFVVSFKLNGSTSPLFINDEPNPVNMENWNANAGLTNPTQIWMGGWGGGEYAKFKMAEFLAYSGDLSEANRKNIVKYLLDKHNIERNDILIGYGDSITKGASATDVDENSYMALAAQGLGCQRYSWGLSGSTAYSMPFSLDFGDYNPNARIVISYGTNEGAVNSTWKAFLKGNVEHLIAKGYDPSRICLMTPPYRSDRVAYNLSILAYLNEIAAEISGVRVADVLTPMLAGGGDALLADGTHPNNAGHVIMANTVIAAFA